MALFIAFEGIDGAGTTTQALRLADWMARHGREAHVTREPSDGAVGNLLREIVGGRLPADARTVALLFAADRLDHVVREIEPALARGRHVVCDRYLLSSLAYQSLDCDAAWIGALNRFAPPPDLTFLIAVRPEVAEARRLAAGRAAERFDAIDLQLRIAGAYERLAAAHGAIVVGGERAPDEVHEEIAARVAARL